MSGSAGATSRCCDRGGCEASTMNLGRVCTVMAFVADPGAAVRFWSAALDAPLHPDLPAVNVGDVLLFFHAADPARNPQGGTVAYFEVARLDELRDALLSAGCVAHRGPLKLADGRRVCQLRDPFGTIWGLEESGD